MKLEVEITREQIQAYVSEYGNCECPIQAALLATHPDWKECYIDENDLTYWDAQGDQHFQGVTPEASQFVRDVDQAMHEWAEVQYAQPEEIEQEFWTVEPWPLPQKIVVVDSED